MIGSQIVDLEPFSKAYTLMAELVHQLRAEGHTIDHLDMGGGLGIDGIAVSPKDPTNMTGLLDRIGKRTLLITHDSDAPDSQRLCYVGRRAMGALESDCEFEFEYDVPPDAWYFDENGARTMPMCVIMEAALQPCGWLASFVGGAVTTETDLMFRNLDGTGRLLVEHDPGLIAGADLVVELGPGAGRGGGELVDVAPPTAPERRRGRGPARG